jgi:hypothetical protein
VVPGLVHQLDEQDRGLVLERDAGVRVHVLQDLPQVVHLRRPRGRIGPHALLAEVAPEARCRGVVERIGPIRAVELDGTEEQVDAALARPGDEVVLEVQMLVGDEIAGAVGSLPVSPEREPETVPAHAGEVGHVLVDHPLSIGAEIASGPVVRRCGKDVVGAEERHFLPGVGPADHALPVEVDAAVRWPRWLLRVREARQAHQEKNDFHGFGDFSTLTP